MHIFKSSIQINLPLQEVIVVLDDNSLRNEWEPGFVKAELIGGQHLQEGCDTRLVFNTGRGNYALIETLLSRHIDVDRCEIKKAHRAKGLGFLTLDTLQTTSEGITLYQSEVVYHFKNPLKLLIHYLKPQVRQIEIDRKTQSFKLYCENRHRYTKE